MALPDLPDSVLQYLVSADSLVRAQLIAAHGDLPAILSSLETRSALLRWLGSGDAFEPAVASLVVSALELLRLGESEQEEAIVRTFLLHENQEVRLRAYECLLTRYFPDKNRQAMVLLLHSMVTDESDMVRTAATDYIQRARIENEMRDFLARWIPFATRRGWIASESYELVERLLLRTVP